MALGPFSVSPASAAGLVRCDIFSRLAKCLILAGLVVAGARLSAGPATAEHMEGAASAQAVPSQGGAAGPARRAAPGLRNARPERRYADGASPAVSAAETSAEVSWSGAL